MTRTRVAIIGRPTMLTEALDIVLTIDGYLVRQPQPTPGLDRLGTLHAADLPRSTWGRPQYYGPPENYDTEADPPITRDRCLAILAEPGDVLPARCARIHGHDGAHRSSLTHYSGHISGAIMPTEWSEG